MNQTPAPAAKPLQALKGVRIVSLALNLPGPAALMRLQSMGANCVKLEPPAPVHAPAGSSGDPMGLYNPAAYATLHQGIKTRSADLKTAAGQKVVHSALAKADVLLTSFRPSALKKLGIDWATLRRAYPALCVVEIVGAPDERAEEPGHDLTYLAEAGLVQGMDLPPTLYADMGGSLMASEAVLQARLAQLKTGKGVRLQVALSDAAHYLALPRTWGLTTPGAAVGGGHAGYRVYACKNGRVAVAALEPHFAKSLCLQAGVADASVKSMMATATHAAVAAFLASKTRAQLEALGAKHDIPLYTLAK
jgi:crotonobetainyl-CoA:carnitine CoA-transferase CaiB-like acyl-CoA transferase